MKLLSLRARGFRNLPDDEPIDFPPGLVFLQGANEAGKSNLLRALKFALFRADTRRSRASLRGWSFEGDFVLEAKLTAGGETFTLRRSSDGTRDVLVLPSGEELRGRPLRKELASLTGVPNERAFDATCCVFQGELPTSGKDLRSLVESSALASGGVDVDKLVSKLRTARDDLLRGDKRASGNPGAIVNAREELRRAREAAARADELQERKKHREKLTDELGQVEAQAADKEKTREELDRYLDAKAEEQRLKEELARLRDEEARLDSTEAEQGRITTALDQKKEALEQKEAESNAALAAARRLGEMEKILLRLDEDRSKEKELRARLKGVPEVTDEDLRNAESIPGELKGLEAPLQVKARPLAEGVTVEMEEDGRKTAPGTFEVRASLSAKVRVPGVVEVEVAAEGVEDEQVRKKGELDRLLSSYGVSSPEELRSIHAERARLQDELRRIRAHREGLLNDSNEAELKRETGTLREHARPADDLRRSTGALRTEVMDLERKRANLGGQVKARREEIPGKRDESLADLAGARAELDGLKSYATFGLEEHARLGREAEEMRRLVDEKKRELHLLEGAISEAQRRRESVRADVEGVRRKLQALERRARVFAATEEGLQNAKLASISSRRSETQDAIGSYLSLFSLGKYSKCEFTDKFSVSLWSEGKGDWIAPDDDAEELSSGLADQVYLACRLAAIESLFREARPPVFLDDPLVHFDPERTAAAIRALKAFAGGFQTIVLTCHTYELPRGAELIAFP